MPWCLVREDVRMPTPDLDGLAAEALAAENLYAPGEWAAIEVLASALVHEARVVGVDPREHAANQIRAIVASGSEDEPFDEDADLARADRAMAAALVWVGRIR